MITYDTKTYFRKKQEIEKNKEVKYNHGTIAYDFDEILYSVKIFYFKV